MTKEKKVMISISSCICILELFYETFFNIYILQEVTTNIALIFAYYMAGIAIAICLYYPFFKLINGKTALWIYRTSFVMSLVLIVLSMTVNSAFAFSLIFINAFKYLYQMCFYCTQEIATMKHVDKNESGNFLAAKVVANTMVKVTFSLVISSIFEFANIFWIFVLLIAIVVLMFILSFGLKTMGADFKFRPLGYWRDTKQYPHMKYIYFCQGLKRMSEAGVVQTIIPIMLYTSMGSEFSVGIYSTIACVAVVCWLPLFVKLKKYKTPILFSSITILILSSIILVIHSSAVTYIIYYLINQLASASFTNAQNASLFDSIKYPVLCDNKEEHCYVYGLFGKTSEMISYGIGILFYVLLPIEYSLPAILIFFMMIKFVSLLLLQKSDSLTKNIQDKQIIHI